MVGGLPSDLPASVLVVLHIAPIGPSVLPAILARHAQLPAAHPSDGDPLEPGRIYVAPPDHHLVVADGRVRIVRGPRENGNRPAADPLFRSVASTFGKRCAGVVLSGALDDGTAGLAAIKEAGGLTIVQDPESAAFPGMPMNAIDFVKPDHVAELQEIPCILTRFAQEVAAVSRTEGDEAGNAVDQHHFDEPPTEFTCPDCGGTLWKVGDRPLQLRCRVGHSFSNESFTLGKQDAIENALWAAIVALEERADLARRLLRRYGFARSDRSSRRFEAEIDQSERGVATLRRLAGELIGPVGHIESTSEIYDHGEA